MRVGSVSSVLRLLVSVLFLAGCATGPRMPLAPTPPTEYLPENFIVDRLGAYVGYRHNLIQTLRADVNIRFADFQGETVSSMNAILAYRAPDHLYVRGYTRFIPQLFLLIVRGNRFWFYVPKDGVLFTGTEADLRTSEEIDLELDGFDILSALVSRPLRSLYRYDKTRQNGFYMVNDYVKDTAKDTTSLARKIWVNTETLDIERELIYSDTGLQRLEIERSEFYVDHGWRLPKFLTLIYPSEQKSTVIMFWDQRVNVPVDETIFDFTPPAGIRIEEL